MPTVRLSDEDDFDGWRAAARALVLADVAPGDVRWQVGEAISDLFATADATPAPKVDAPAFSVPKAFPPLAETAILHRDPERFALLHALLLKLREQPKALEDHADPLLRRIEDLAKAVRRDIHKMRAFLRFRSVAEPDGAERFVAWFEPEHHIVRANAGFFVRRFATMRWSILTPEVSIHWDGETLSESDGAVRGDAPEGDPAEEVWKTYYASIFNPARLKPAMMLREMPRKYWKNMPETALVPQLIAGAQAREREMMMAATARPTPSGNAALALDALREEAAGCTRCPLYRPATQTVFGEGPADAPLMFVGEQPGDNEDIAGRPFVGPAGQLFDRAMAEAGVDRSAAYVTNAVKHFKFEARGKRRIHAKPGHRRDRGLPLVDRAGARHHSARAHRRAGRHRGAFAVRQDDDDLARPRATAGARRRFGMLVTVHPSFLLRIPEEDRRAEEYARFVADLRAIDARLKEKTA